VASYEGGPIISLAKGPTKGHNPALFIARISLNTGKTIWNGTDQGSSIHSMLYVDPLVLISEIG